MPSAVKRGSSSNEPVCFLNEFVAYFSEKGSLIGFVDIRSTWQLHNIP